MKYEKLGPSAIDQILADLAKGGSSYPIFP